MYATITTVIYLRFGKAPMLTLPILAFIAVPVIGYATKSKEFVRSSLLFVTVILTYEALQGLEGVLVSSGSVINLTHLDKSLVGFNLARHVQLMFRSPTVTLIATVFYGMHVFLIMIALGIFWFANRTVYRGYTYAMVITSYLALLTFVVLPSAPPWIAGTARNLLVSGNNMLPSVFHSLQTMLLSGETDLFAAFPSLHAAYATLFSAFMFKLGRKWGFLSLPVLGGVYFSIIYLGQHFLVDLLAGAAYALFSVYIVHKIMNRSKKVQTASQTAAATPL